MRRFLMLLAIVTLSGCQVVVSNPYPGQPLPEHAVPPRNLTLSLLQVFGGRSPEVVRGVYRVRGVFARPVDVSVRNMSRKQWRRLRTSLRIDGDAVATCSLRDNRYVPYYICQAPHVPYRYGYYDYRY